ncbi:MAG: cytochrome d ubiquinol oxidase subunit II [Actinomycetota bacterium]
MNLPEVVLAATWVGLSAYALLAGADFGGGFWDLVAGGARRGAAQRMLIEHSIGPVWEANHVWLIFALVVVWTGFPPAFAAVASTLYVPLTAAAFGIILRGSGFAFRKVVEELPLRRVFGATFAFSSVLTPFFLGAIAGAIASGRVPVGNAAGDPISSWLNPTSVLAGAYAVAICAYLAAVYLTQDALRDAKIHLAEQFRTRALWSGVVAGAIALAGIGVVRVDAPALFDGLMARGLVLIPLSAAGGVATLAFVWTRRYVAARAAAALAVGAVLWGWAAGQYPYLLPGALTIGEAVASRRTLEALVWVLSVGGLLVVPSLIWLFVLFQRGAPAPSGQGQSREAPREAR